MSLEPTLEAIDHLRQQADIDIDDLCRRCAIRRQTYWRWREGRNTPEPGRLMLVWTTLQILIREQRDAAKRRLDRLTALIDHKEPLTIVSEAERKPASWRDVLKEGTENGQET